MESHQMVTRLFLSTPSARRATQFFGIGRGLFWNFYPRPPRGGRHNILRDDSAKKV